MTIFGVGPVLAGVGIAACGAILAGQYVPGWRLAVPPSLDLARWVAAGVLGVLGLALWAGGTRLIFRGFPAGRLVTTGVYRITRNPMYAAFIVLLIPALALAMNNLLTLVASAVVYAAFKLLIGREERYLSAKFGAEYEAYRRRVPQLMSGIP